MTNSNNVLIVGPSPNVNYIGGVHTHVKMLKNLDVFRTAKFCDPGSFYGNIQTPTIKILLNIIALRKIVFKYEIDTVLIASSIYQSSFLKLLFILFVLPINKIKNIHVFFEGGRFENIKYLKQFFLKYVITTILKRGTGYHFLCNEMKYGFEKHFQGYKTQMFLNYSGENTIFKKNNKRSSNLNLLFVGRVVRNKGIFELFEAFEFLYNNISKNIHLSIVGDGPDRKELQSKVDTSQIPNIVMKGFLSGSDLEREYINADLLVLPTYHDEGFPFSMIEAYRAGVPIIATTAGAMADVIQDGVNGIFISPNDSSSIVRAIKKCIDNKELIDTMSNNCYDYFKSKLTKSHAEEYYTSLLN